MRPETGSMEFDGDWPGVFIRGDQALYWGAFLKSVVTTGDSLLDIQIKSLSKLLLSCNAKNAAQTRMKEFWMCVDGPCNSCKHYKKKYFGPNPLDYIMACDCVDSPRYRQQVRSDDGCGEWEG